MSCPDATPDADVLEIDRLEREARIAAERVIDAKNERYFASAKFWNDLDDLVKIAGKPGYGQKEPVTVEEKIEWVKKQFSTAQAEYAASLYK